MLFNVLEEFGLQYAISALTFVSLGLVILDCVDLLWSRLMVQMGQSFYYEIKAVAVLYLMFFNGAETIFETVIKPFMDK